jgi:histidine triad (HIT) family protein
LDCIFCKIGRGEIKGEIVERDDRLFVLKDIHPQAPVHLLVMPFEHIASADQLDASRVELAGRMVLMANRAAAKAGVAKSGYRLVVNCGKEGGQTVGHLHMHVLGGRQMGGDMTGR